MLVAPNISNDSSLFTGAAQDGTHWHAQQSGRTKTRNVWTSSTVHRYQCEQRNNGNVKDAHGHVRHILWNLPSAQHLMCGITAQLRWTRLGMYMVTRWDAHKLRDHTWYRCVCAYLSFLNQNAASGWVSSKFYHDFFRSRIRSFSGFVSRRSFVFWLSNVFRFSSDYFSNLACLSICCLIQVFVLLQNTSEIFLGSFST